MNIFSLPRILEVEGIVNGVIHEKETAVYCMMGGPEADAWALVGSLRGQPRLVEKEKAREVSVPSLSSVPSTILHRERSEALEEYSYHT